ncbi:KIR protein [Plasmodium coatneyi]|uniref:KIR protein n=1 Tax=Plasmodium coatneyi TaxID=208452 RepID=A0A1B1E4J1_9APIC|nr:KIR protein [Plasmodium coatneyi]ANQ09933.1 KIR protein [Plasmodium coatneyi]
MTKDLQCKVEDLPSRKVYKAFGNNARHGEERCSEITSKEEEIEEILKGKLKNDWDPGKYAKQIAPALCLLSKLDTKKKESCEKICDFFYFWLGDILCNNWRSTSSFKDSMKEIYGKLKDLGGQCKYEAMHNNVSKTIFPQRKKVFDYLHDYKTIIQDLKESKSSGSSCCEDYATYLEQAISAYGQIEAGWKVSSDEYFKKFWTQFKGNGNGDRGDSGKIPKPSNLNCEGIDGIVLESDAENEDGTNLVNCLTQLSAESPELQSITETEHGPVSTEVHSSSVGRTSTPTAVTISGTLATAAVATISFLLYKVSTK